ECPEIGRWNIYTLISKLNRLSGADGRRKYIEIRHRSSFSQLAISEELNVVDVNVITKIVEGFEFNPHIGFAVIFTKIQTKTRSANVAGYAPVAFICGNEILVEKCSRCER